MSASKPVLLSGIKPTGELHLGNYFGAIRQQVELLNKGNHDCFIMVADYHALNFIQDAGQMQELSRELAMGYIAAGLDPEKVTLFKQSDVSAHTELAWILDTITTMPYLMRAHAFKDAQAKSAEISVGTFNYPMLMAADILLYDAAVVPVGQDQKQHIEYARDTAEKFNRIFAKEGKEIFTLPEPHIMPDVAVVPGTDGQKMSKSYGNTIQLFGTREDLVESVMGIVTNSQSGRPEHVYALHKLVKTEAELESLYSENEGKYKVLKEALIEDLDALLSPMRATYNTLKENPQMIDDVLARGGEHAQKVANEKMKTVRKAIGVA
jgi:tryptophanyl-tRNA synthetase